MIRLYIYLYLLGRIMIVLSIDSCKYILSLKPFSFLYIFEKKKKIHKRLVKYVCSNIIYMGFLQQYNLFIRFVYKTEISLCPIYLFIQI